MLRHGTVGFGRQVLVSLGWSGSGSAGLVGYGMVGSCTACLGLAGMVWNGEARLVEAWLCVERFGW